MIKIINCKTEMGVGAKAACVMADVIKNKPNAVIGLATGSSPLTMYAELIKKYESGELFTRRFHIMENHFYGFCATYLLTTTGLQIQTVALHCGIMDVQYFTKIFKRMKGMTPRQYREASKGISAL